LSEIMKIRIWPFKKKMKDDAKIASAAVGMAGKEPITDRMELEDVKNKAKPKDSDPMTRKEARELAVATLDTISDQVSEIRSEWEYLKDKLNSETVADREKLNEEFNGFQEKTLNLLNNISNYFEDKQKIDSEAQQKAQDDLQEIKNALCNEIEKMSKGFTDRMDEIEANNNKKFSELEARMEAKIDNKLAEFKKELSESEEDIVKKFSATTARMNVRDRETAEASEKLNEQRKRVDDLLEVMSKFIGDHKESIKASTNIHRVYLMMLDLFKDIMDSKGISYKITEPFVREKMSETVDNNLKEIQFLISKTKMEQETMERIRFEVDAKEKKISH